MPPSPEEIRLKHRIDEIYTQHTFMGYRTIVTIMNREGDVIHNNTVRIYMREMGIMAVYPGRNLQHRIYPYLLRGLKITEPNQVGLECRYYLQYAHLTSSLSGIKLLEHVCNKCSFYTDMSFPCCDGE
ncbi:IS3 family transposase [Marinicrinis sediminis]|uniref:IS3 family transposase n=1 Tax=Marinicrinis sediminis TaxID=1652465 RepID=A0ABW5RBN9_9BACL